jgi:hypothetical protein
LFPEGKIVRSCSATLWSSPCWHSDHLVSEAIMLAVIVLPSYTLALSEQIVRAKREICCNSTP